jgi:hypothetical protein
MDPQSLAHLSEALAAVSENSAPASDEGLWPENAETVRAFLAVTSQFRVVVIGGGFEPSRLLTMGFDYAGVRAGLDAEGIAVTPDLWRGLKIMEDAAAAALNEGN